MNKIQEGVRDWSQKFQQAVAHTPTIPSLEVRKLRAKLILEEAKELIAGLGFRLGDDYLAEDGEVDLAAIADGIADLNFVSYGTAVACGIDMEPIEKEVLRSNMSKLWTRRELVDFKLGAPHNYTFTCVKDGCNGLYPCSASADERSVLVRNKDGKVIKSPSYSPANIQL